MLHTFTNIHFWLWLYDYIRYATNPEDTYISVANFSSRLTSLWASLNSTDLKRVMPTWCISQILVTFATHMPSIDQMSSSRCRVVVSCCPRPSKQVCQTKCIINVSISHIKDPVWPRASNTHLGLVCFRECMFAQALFEIENEPSDLQRDNQRRNILTMKRIHTYVHMKFITYTYTYIAVCMYVCIYINRWIDN